jgi:hypothetical protein
MAAIAAAGTVVLGGCGKQEPIVVPLPEAAQGPAEKPSTSGSPEAADLAGRTVLAPEDFPLGWKAVSADDARRSRRIDEKCLAAGGRQLAALSAGRARGVAYSKEGKKQSATSVLSWDWIFRSSAEASSAFRQVRFRAEVTCVARGAARALISGSPAASIERVDPARSRPAEVGDEEQGLSVRIRFRQSRLRYGAFLEEHLVRAGPVIARARFVGFRRPIGTRLRDRLLDRLAASVGL